MFAAQGVASKMSVQESVLQVGFKRSSVAFVSCATVFIAFCVAYVPTFFELSRTLWSTDQNAHGPIVLGISIWYFYFKIKKLLSEGVRPEPSRGLLPWLVLMVGLSLFSIGRSQDFYLFEVGSLIPVCVGVFWLSLGGQFTKRLWFAFFFLFFLIPLPGSVIDALTQPMKISVSYGAEHLLFWLDYPIARSGVVLVIGQYKLLVADACAGLNSLFTLEALGLLYLNVVRSESVKRNVTLALLIVPISYTSNLVRVVVLALITYHFGDAAGQGFLHGFSGMVLFLTALVLIITVDGLLHRIYLRRSKGEA